MRGKSNDAVIDAGRYPLLTNEYRYALVYLPGVASRYAKARSLEIESRLNSAAEAYPHALALSALFGTPKRRLEVVVSGCDVINIDSFVGGIPTAQITIPSLRVNGLFGITRAQIDEDNDLTALEAWGG